MTPTAIATRSDRIQRTLEHLRQHTTDTTGQLVPFGPGQYTDPVLAQRERDLVFGRVPSIVAHASELPEPNDFITLQMPRNRVIVARQHDGSVKAFVNVCRHRGALLEEQESGRCRLFSCGYHRWSYNTDGSLRTITREATFGEVDRSRHGLIELPAQERHGLIWMVDRAGAPIDVAAWLGPEMDEILAGYRLGELTAFRYEGFDEPANWKLMQDAFVDNYHIQYAHPNTAGKHIHTNVQTVEDFGRHARMVSPRKAIDRWLEEDPGETDLGPYVTEGHFLLPNSTLLRQPDDHFELLTRGLSIFYERGFEPARTLRRLAEAKIQIMAGVPVLFEQMAKLPAFADADLSALKLVTIAGARAPVPVIRAWLDKGVLLRQAYGMTELGGISSLNPAEQAVNRPESVGRGTVFTRHRVVRLDGSDCDPEEPGEIIVSGPGVTPGYWRNEAAYGDAMRDGWFHSGDVGVKDADGFIRVVDRLKDIIITGGYNVAPSEIEAVISELPAVIEVCVVSAADAKFGEAPAAVIYAGDAITAEEVTAHCRERLAGYKVPRHVIVQDQPLERMASGKIARRKIRDAHPGLAATAQPVG